MPRLKRRQTIENSLLSFRIVCFTDPRQLRFPFSFAQEIPRGVFATAFTETLLLCNSFKSVSDLIATDVTRKTVHGILMESDHSLDDLSTRQLCVNELHSEFKQADF